MHLMGGCMYLIGGCMHLIGGCMHLIGGCMHLIGGCMHLMCGCMYLMGGYMHLIGGCMYLMRGCMRLIGGCMHLMRGFMHLIGGCMHLMCGFMYLMGGCMHLICGFMQNQSAFGSNWKSHPQIQFIVIRRTLLFSGVGRSHLFAEDTVNDFWTPLIRQYTCLTKFDQTIIISNNRNTVINILFLKLWLMDQIMDPLRYSKEI